MLGTTEAFDMRILKLLENIVRAVCRSVRHNFDFHPVSRIIQCQQMSDFLPQQGRTIVDSKDNTHGGKSGSLPRWTWLESATQVHPEWISRIGVEHEACGAPKCVDRTVCSTHLVLRF